QLQVCFCQLLGERRLAFFGVTLAEPIGGGLEQAVQALAHCLRRECGGATRGVHTVLRQTCLKILGAARSPPGLPDAAEKQEYAAGGDGREYQHERHLIPPRLNTACPHAAHEWARRSTPARPRRSLLNDPIASVLYRSQCGNRPPCPAR